MLEKLIGGLPTMPQVEAGDLFYLVLRDAEGYRLARRACGVDVDDERCYAELHHDVTAESCCFHG